MAQADPVQRVRMYLSQADQWEGIPHYLAILDRLRRAGATGATALQGLAGFGPGQRGRSPLLPPPEQQRPVVVEWIDRAERVSRVLPSLDDLLAEILVTVETVPIHRATLRARGPFAVERSAGDLMRTPAPAIAPEAPLVEALARLVSEGLGVLPVVDARGHLVGLITQQDLAWRAGLHLTPSLLPLLTAEEHEAIIAPLRGQAVRDVMSTEARSVGASTSIPQALVTMIEWGYPQIPVVDREGRLAGLLGQDHVLREAASQASASPRQGAVQDAEPPTPVRLVMQMSQHQLPLDTRLNSALAQILATPGRHLYVVTPTGRLLGALDEAAIIRALADEERATFLTALQDSRQMPATALPGASRGIEGIYEQDPPAIRPEDSLLEAARRLLDFKVERMAVVDEDRQLLGVIARGGLIRALLQQSE